MSFYSFKARGSSRFLLGSIALAAAGFGLAGCGDDTNTTSRTGPDFTQVHTLTGTVVGTLLDNNGQVISGAVVSIPDGAIAAKALGASTAKLSVVTDSHGQFSIPNVKVIQVISASTGAAPPHAPISIQVDAPAGYLDATIAVPISAESIGGDLVAQTNPQVVLVDGFTVDIGAARLPGTAATITGTLRRTVSDEPVAGPQTVNLDFRGFIPDNPAAGVVLTYAQGILSTTTASNGTFTITGLAEDSCYNLSVAGFSVDGIVDAGGNGGCPAAVGGGPAPGPGTFHTRNENNLVFGNITVSPGDTTDNVNPFVTRVDQVIADGANPGPLASGTTGTGADALRIRLSETLRAGSAANVRVTRVTPFGAACAAGATEQLLPSTTTLTLGTTSNGVNGALLVVDMANSLVVGAKYCVYIATETLADLEGNILVDSAFTGGIEPNGVGYDFASNRDVVLTLITPNTPVTGLQPVTNIVQVSDSVNPASDQFFATTETFLDTVENGFDGPVGVLFESNLNSPASSARRAANELSDAINDGDVDCSNFAGIFPVAGPGGCVAGGGPVPYDRTTARIRFDQPAAVDGQPTAVDYVILNDFVDIVVGPSLDGNYTVTANAVVLDEPFSDGVTAADVIKPDAGYTGPIEFFVTGLAPGDQVKIVTRGDVDGNGTADIVDSNAVATSAALLDNASPFTGINLLAKALAARTTVGGNASGGGVILPPNAVRAGLPILPVTPQALDISDTSGNGFVGDSYRGVGELETLSNGALRARHDLVLGGVDTQYADATGTAAFFASAQPIIGITVTEPLAAGQPAPRAAAGSTIRTTFLANGVLNNTLDETGLAATARDYYTVTVGNLLDWQRDGQARTIIELPGLVDANGLAAPTTGQKVPAVQVRDVLPPLMTRAFFDGRLFVFEFTEAIRTGVGAITLTNCGATIGLNAGLFAGTGAATISSDGRVLVVPAARVTGLPADPNSCFNDTTSDTVNLNYAEPGFYTAAEIAALGSRLPTAAVDPTPAHGFVDYSTVEDRVDNSDIGLFAGNSWAKWGADTDGATPGIQTALGIANVQFAIANVVGPFGEVNNIAACGSFAPPATTATCQLVLTQPIKLDWGLPADPDVPAVTADPNGHSVSANNEVTEAEVLAYFNAKFGVVSGPGDAAPDVRQDTGAVRFTLRDGNGNVVNLQFPIDASTPAGRDVLNSGVDLTLAYSTAGIVPQGDPATCATCVAGAGNADRFWILPGGTPADPLGIYSAFDPGQQLERDDGAAPRTPGELLPTVVR